MNSGVKQLVILMKALTLEETENEMGKPCHIKTTEESCIIPQPYNFYHYGGREVDQKMLKCVLINFVTIYTELLVNLIKEHVVKRCQGCKGRLYHFRKSTKKRPWKHTCKSYKNLVLTYKEFGYEIMRKMKGVKLAEEILFKLKTKLCRPEYRDIILTFWHYGGWPKRPLVDILNEGPSTNCYLPEKIKKRLYAKVRSYG